MLQIRPRIGTKLRVGIRVGVESAVGGIVDDEDWAAMGQHNQSKQQQHHLEG